MNDKMMLQAIRKLPKAWVSNDTNVTRFQHSVIAVHPFYNPMRFHAGKWRPLSLTSAVKR